MPKSISPNYRVRSIPAQFNVREMDGGPVIEAYFAVFGPLYEIWKDQFECIDPRAFDDDLAANSDVRALIDHDSRLVLGRTIAGTLILDVDEKGLHGVIKVNPHDTDAMNLYARIQRGDVNQCSFGFDILDEEYTVRPDGTTLATIRKVKLYEVSVVTFPAYTETSAEARSVHDVDVKRRHLEAWRENMRRILNHGNQSHS